jgi:hypothetical protein
MANSTNQSIINVCSKVPTTECMLEQLYKRHSGALNKAIVDSLDRYQEPRIIDAALYGVKGAAAAGATAARLRKILDWNATKSTS